MGGSRLTLAERRTGSGRIYISVEKRQKNPLPRSATAVLLQVSGGTLVTAHGDNLNLFGLSFGRFLNGFNEEKPLDAFGTFSLS